MIYVQIPYNLMVKCAISVPHRHLNPPIWKSTPQLDGYLSTAHECLYNVDFRLWHISTLIPNRLENTNSMKRREKGKSFLPCSPPFFPQPRTVTSCDELPHYSSSLVHFSAFVISRIDPHTAVPTVLLFYSYQSSSPAHTIPLSTGFTRGGGARGSEAAGYASLTPK